MRVIPEDHPSKLPPETLFEQASLEDLPEPLSKGDACPRKTPSLLESFEAFPKPCRMPPFEASAETPAVPSFGKCHLSWKPARRSSPRKPLSTRLRTRPFGMPSEHATCPEG